ncbi:hypothetical protein GQX74_007069, partial [Glossina fuscipes]
MKNFKTLANKFFSLHKNSSIFHRTLIRTLRYNIFKRIVEQQQFLLRNKSFLFSNIIQYKGIENVLSPREMMFIWVKELPSSKVNCYDISFECTPSLYTSFRMGNICYYTENWLEILHDIDINNRQSVSLIFNSIFPK